MTEMVPEGLVEQMEKLASKPMPKIDTADERKEAQLALGEKDVDIHDLKSQLKQIKEEQQLPEKSEVEKLQEELKQTQITNEALKGVLGEFIKFTELVLPEVQKTAGQHQSFFQIQQMVMIGKMLAGEPMPENIQNELGRKNEQSNK